MWKLNFKFKDWYWISAERIRKSSFYILVCNNLSFDQVWFIPFWSMVQKKQRLVRCSLVSCINEEQMKLFVQGTLDFPHVERNDYVTNWYKMFWPCFPTITFKMDTVVFVVLLAGCLTTLASGNIIIRKYKDLCLQCW